MHMSGIGTEYSETITSFQKHYIELKKNIENNENLKKINSQVAKNLQQLSSYKKNDYFTFTEDGNLYVSPPSFSFYIKEFLSRNNDIENLNQFSRFMKKFFKFYPLNENQRMQTKTGLENGIQTLKKIEKQSGKKDIIKDTKKQFKKAINHLERNCKEGEFDERFLKLAEHFNSTAKKDEEKVMLLKEYIRPEFEEVVEKNPSLKTIFTIPKLQEKEEQLNFITEAYLKGKNDFEKINEGLREIYSKHIPLAYKNREAFSYIKNNGFTEFTGKFEKEKAKKLEIEKASSDEKAQTLLNYEKVSSALINFVFGSGLIAAAAYYPKLQFLVPVGSSLLGKGITDVSQLWETESKEVPEEVNKMIQEVFELVKANPLQAKEKIEGYIEGKKKIGKEFLENKEVEKFFNELAQVGISNEEEQKNAVNEGQQPH